MGKAAAGLAVAFVGIQTIRLGKNLIQDAVNTGDSLAKLSGELDVGVEQLQRWQFAGERLGVSAQLTNTSLRVLQKRLAEAKADTGPLVAGLKKLDEGLLENIKSAATTEEAFQRVIEGMNATASSVARAGIANAAFSRTGLPMVRLVEQGADEFRRLGDRGEELGAILSDKAVRSAADLQDALTDLGASLSGRLNNAILENSQNITDLANAMVDAIPDLIAFTREMGLFFGLFEKNAADRLDAARVAIQQTAFAIQNAQAKVMRGGIGGPAARRELAALQTQYAEQLQALEKFRADVEKENAASEARIAARRQQRLEKENAASEARIAARRQQRLEKENAVELATRQRLQERIQKDARTNIIDFNREKQKRENEVGQAATDAAVRLFGERMDAQERMHADSLRARAQLESEAEAILVSLRTPQEQVDINLEGAQGLLKAELIDQDTFDAYKQQQLEFLASTRDVTNEWSQLWTDTLSTFSSGVGDAVAEAIFEQENLNDALRNILRGVIKQVVSTLVQIGVQQLVLSQIGKKAAVETGATTSASMASISASAAPAAAGVSLATVGGNAAPALAAVAAVFGLAATLAFAGAFHEGGVVGGPQGKEQLALVKGGETIIPIGAAGAFNGGKAGGKDQLASETIIPTGFAGVFHDGGMVGGARGQQQLALVQGGETIIPINDGRVNDGATGNSLSVNFSIQAVDTRGIDRLLRDRQGLIVQMVQRAFERSGRRGGPIR